MVESTVAGVAEHLGWGPGIEDLAIWHWDLLGHWGLLDRGLRTVAIERGPGSDCLRELTAQPIKGFTASP